MNTPSAFLSYGFRPFFLLAASWVLIAGGLLAASFMGLTWPLEAVALTRWHGHEMLFGFVAAAIAGFLLTAVANWTSRPPVRGAPLLALVVLWIAGRVVMLPWLALDTTAWALIDAAFLPALAVAIAASLLPADNRRNFGFIPLLAALTLLNVLFHAQQQGWVRPLPYDPLRVAIDVVLIVIAIIAGRIVPLFTRNALLREGINVTMAATPRLEQAVFVVLAGVLLVDVLAPTSPLAGWLALLAAVLLALRLSRWHGHRTLGLPIVWILHAGYAWLVLAFVLKGAWLVFAQAWAVNWLHGFTAGAFGTLILGVASRVALGHTGRELTVGAPITAAYLLVILGALLRIFGPALMPAAYHSLIPFAIMLWGAGYAIFLVVYLPILLGPRVSSA